MKRRAPVLPFDNGAGPAPEPPPSSPASPYWKEPAIRSLAVNWDVVVFLCETLDDDAGRELETAWLAYMTRRAVERMNPATLFQVSTQQHRP